MPSRLWFPLLVSALGFVPWQGVPPTSRVIVYGVGFPTGTTVRWGSQSTVVFRVAVRNDSTQAAPYAIRMELEGVTATSTTPLSTIAAGEIVSVRVSVDVDLRSRASGGLRLPFSAVLLDDRGRIRSRFVGNLPVANGRPLLALDPAAVPRPLAFSRDIGIERIEHTVYGAITSEATTTASQFSVVLRNSGQERWAYTGDLVAAIATGTPETHLEWSDRFIVRTVALPLGLASGERVLIQLRLQPVMSDLAIATAEVPPALPADLWLTVRVDIASAYDVNSSNNARYYVFRLGRDRRVLESRIVPAPTARPSVRIQ